MSVIAITRNPKLGVVRFLAIMLALTSYRTTVGAQPRCQVGTFLATYSDSMHPNVFACERTINHSWGQDGPKVTEEGKADGARILLEPDHFKVRWEGVFIFDAGTFNFIAESDDGIRVWVDGVQILDEWRSQQVKRSEVARPLTAGEHKIRVEYFEDTDEAVARFWWERKY